MPDFSGPLPRLVLTRTLWLVAALPLAGFAWHAVVERRAAAHEAGAETTRRARGRSRAIGLASVSAASVAVLAHVAAFWQGGRWPLFEAIETTRVGPADLGVALWFDGPSAAACAWVCGLALAAGGWLAGRPAVERCWNTWAWLELALGGALLTFVADGFVTTAMGWTLAAAAGAWLEGWSRPRAGAVAATRSAVAVAALAIGASVLFWGLGPVTSNDLTLTNPALAVAAVHDDPPAPPDVPADPDADTAAAPDPTLDGALTLVAMAGADVLVDDAKTPLDRAPFVDTPVTPGTHTLRVRSGPSSRPSIVRASIAPGEHVALVPLGPSLSFHVVAAALGVHDAAGAFAARGTLERRTGLGGLDVVGTAMALLMLAAGAMSGAWPPAGAPPALIAVAQCASTAALGPFLLARTAFLAPLAPRLATMVPWLGVATLAAATTHALGHRGKARWFALAASAPAASMWIALGVGGLDADSAVMAMVMAGVGVVSAGAILVTSPIVPRATAASDEAVPEPAPAWDERLFERAPARMGLLLTRFERWVVDPVAGAGAGLVRATAWVAARADARVLARPSDAMAMRVLRGARKIEPLIGLSLAALAWTLTWTVVGLAALFAAAHVLGVV